MHSALSLSDVEEKCKQAAALKLPLSRLELNTDEVQELFQVSNTNVSTRLHFYSRQFVLVVAGTALAWAAVVTVANYTLPTVILLDKCILTI